jgi:energy-coupling factor transporter ATP-binding protein EcfA2
MRGPEQLPFDPEKFSSTDNAVTRCLLNLAFKIEKLERIVSVAPDLNDQLRQLKELRQHVLSLSHDYDNYKNQARAFDAAYDALVIENSKGGSEVAYNFAVELLSGEVPADNITRLRILSLLRLASFYKEISSLAIESISNAIDSFEKGVTPEELQQARKILSSYVTVVERSTTQDTNLEVTPNPTYLEIVKLILDNPQISRVIIAGPPGSGKTRAISALIKLLHQEDIGAVEKSFDRHFQAVMKALKIPSSEWSLYQTKLFDRMALKALPMMAAHYPPQYKADKIRKVDIIDALGYPVNINEPWHMVLSSADEINNGEYIVWYIVAEDAVIQEGIKNRAEGEINTQDMQALARDLDRGGAPAGTVIKHISNLRNVITSRAKKDKALRQKIKSVSLTGINFEHYDTKMREDLASRIGYAYWLPDSLGIKKSQWFVSVNKHEKQR